MEFLLYNKTINSLKKESIVAKLKNFELQVCHCFIALFYIAMSSSRITAVSHLNHRVCSTKQFTHTYWDERRRKLITDRSKAVSSLQRL